MSVLLDCVRVFRAPVEGSEFCDVVSSSGCLDDDVLASPFIANFQGLTRLGPGRLVERYLSTGLRSDKFRNFLSKFVELAVGDGLVGEGIVGRLGGFTHGGLDAGSGRRHNDRCKNLRLEALVREIAKLEIYRSFEIEFWGRGRARCCTGSFRR